MSQSLTLTRADEDSRYTAVRLRTDLLKRKPPLSFTHVDGGWELTLDVPEEARRLEYQLELVHRDGTREIATDPGASTADGPFGSRSVVELPGYEQPAWLEDQPADGTVAPIEVESPTLRSTLRGLRWDPAGVDTSTPLPLLVVHDGPEHAAYSHLARYLDVLAARDDVPAFRAALLAPVQRNETYSASPGYASALHDDVLPRLRESLHATALAGMGASLGALSFLHLHRTHPDSIGGLFLQSGSFFRPRQDAQESGFPRFARITAFVQEVLGATTWEDPVPVTMTCGLLEENLDSNGAIADALASQGYGVNLALTGDGHNWVSWRDAYDPSLATLLRTVFG